MGKGKEVIPAVTVAAASSSISLQHKEALQAVFSAATGCI